MENKSENFNIARTIRKMKFDILHKLKFLNFKNQCLWSIWFHHNFSNLNNSKTIFLFNLIFLKPSPKQKRTKFDGHFNNFIIKTNPSELDMFRGRKTEKITSTSITIYLWFSSVCAFNKKKVRSSKGIKMFPETFIFR